MNSYGIDSFSRRTMRCAPFVLSYLWNESLVLLLYDAQQENLWSIWVSGESCSFLFIAEILQVADSKYHGDKETKLVYPIQILVISQAGCMNVGRYALGRRSWQNVCWCRGAKNTSWCLHYLKTQHTVDRLHGIKLKALELTFKRFIRQVCQYPSALLGEE